MAGSEPRRGRSDDAPAVTDAVLRRLGELCAVAVPRPGIDAVSYLRRRLAEGALDAVVLDAARSVDAAAAADAAAVVEAWAGAEPGSDEAALFVAVRALGWEILLADPARGGDPDGRGWDLMGHDGRPKARRP